MGGRRLHRPNGGGSCKRMQFVGQGGLGGLVAFKLGARVHDISLLQCTVVNCAGPGGRKERGASAAARVVIGTCSSAQAGNTAGP